MGGRAIHFAISGGHVDIINALVNDYGVDPNSKVSYALVYTYLLI